MTPGAYYTVQLAEDAQGHAFKGVLAILRVSTSQLRVANRRCALSYKCPVAGEAPMSAIGTETTNSLLAKLAKCSGARTLDRSLRSVAIY
jgi:hypothetical protein